MKDSYVVGQQLLQIVDHINHVFCLSCVRELPGFNILRQKAYAYAKANKVDD